MELRRSSFRDRWPRPAAFYAERDHRTELEVQELRKYAYKPIEIHVEAESAGDVTIQRMAILVANLTARWARNVQVFIPDVPLASALQTFEERTLCERVRREMREADPFGNFDVGVRKDSDPYSIRLWVGFQGNNTFPHTIEDYAIDAAGWTILGRRGSNGDCPSIRNATVGAAALSAAIGAADVFKRAIGHVRGDWFGDIDWCTWNHILGAKEGARSGPSLSDSFDLGNILVAGVGAVGSAVLYILGMTSIHGEITLLDMDRVEASNLNRSPLFSAEDALTASEKTEVGRKFLARLGCEARVINGPWHQHCRQLGEERFDAWISLTNERGAWAEVPFQLPPVVLHGTTTSGWGVAAGRHIPRIEDCTVCRLPRPLAEFRGPCAEGELPTVQDHEPIRAALPFLSTASAALIVTELLKLQFGEAGALPNGIWADFRKGLPAVISQTLRSNPSCPGCQLAWLPEWKERGGRGRYVNLSEVSAPPVRASCVGLT
jgi:hypothetical protein